MPTPRHQVASATTRMRDIADALVDASVWSMSGPEVAATLVELTRLEVQVVELRSRVAAHAAELQVGHDVGATSTASWLAHETKVTRRAAAGTMRLGRDLAAHHLVRDALARGNLRVAQATVIIGAVDALPEDLDPDLVTQAERHLVTAAAEHDARTLRILGRRVLEVVAPELAGAHEADLLAKEAAKAARACRLTMSGDGHGNVHGRFTLPTAQAARLSKMLVAIAAPQHQAATHGVGAGVQRRPGPERMGRAFCELIERLSAQPLPRVGAAARTIPVVPGGNSGDLDLDLGRARRFFTKARTIAIAVRGSRRRRPRPAACAGDSARCCSPTSATRTASGAAVAMTTAATPP